MLTISQANQYFHTCLHSDPWDTSDDNKRQKALATAERELELYRDRVDSTRFFYAICEQAVWLLSPNQRTDLQQAGVKAASIGRVSETFDLQGRPPTIAPRAWEFLRPPKVGSIV